MTVQTQQVFAALADGTRRTMIAVLASGVSRTSTEFASEFDISRQGVAKHLERLEEAGLVHGERQGRETRYTFMPEPLADVAGWIAAVEERWDQRLMDLKAYAEETYQGPDGGDEDGTDRS